MQKAEAQRGHSYSNVPFEPRGQFAFENQISESRGGAERRKGQQPTPHDGGQSEDLGVGDLGEHKWLVRG